MGWRIVVVVVLLILSPGGLNSSGAFSQTLKVTLDPGMAGAIVPVLKPTE
ncbi:MAG: hypothetical protein HY671_13920 [Chloroflexi bacterium]|nr:hypothetical protein [Chloroflexota bacterium]